MMSEFHLACPTSTKEVMDVLSHAQRDVAFLSGGTDLVLQINNGDKRPDLVIDLSQIPELSYIREGKDGLRIGSGTILSQISTHTLIWQKARCLAQAAEQVGSTQIRNRATLGGNIASASPAGDTLPALLVMEAQLNILGPGGERWQSFASLQTGGEEGLQRGEFITEIFIPWPFALRQGNVVSGFAKIGSRKAVTIARLNMAGILRIDRETSVISEARFALGALAKAPFRLKHLEDEVRQQPVNEDLARGIAARLMETVDQAIPGRSSKEYKRQAVQGLANDLFHDLFPDVFDLNLDEGGAFDGE